MYVPVEEENPIPKMMDIDFFKHQRLIVLRNRGRMDPEKIDEYIGFDGYQALAKVLTSMTPLKIIEEIREAGLRGRGGCGSPWYGTHDSRCGRRIVGVCGAKWSGGGECRGSAGDCWYCEYREERGDIRCADEEIRSGP